MTSRFTRHGDQFIVRTDGPDGVLTDYPSPTRSGSIHSSRNLLRLPGGRLQALSIAWDTRPKAQGGQRWFHLYPSERVDHRDVLHWTGPAQNWNHMCAECHSTNVQKGYAADRDSFDTRWSEVNVSCEACHGPGSQHIEWARQKPPAGDRHKGFVFSLDGRSRMAWSFDGDRPIAARPRRCRRDPRSRRADDAIRAAARSGLTTSTAVRSPTRIACRFSKRGCMRPMASSSTRCTNTARSCRARCTQRA